MLGFEFIPRNHTVVFLRFPSCLDDMGPLAMGEKKAARGCYFKSNSVSIMKGCKSSLRMMRAMTTQTCKVDHHR